MYKLMLVNDKKLITQGLLNILDWEELGIQISSIHHDGQSALDSFINNPVDIVISDINISKINGLDLLKKTKEINSGTRFILLSGYDDFSYAKKAIEYGIDSYILKPINKEEFCNSLKRIVSNINNERNKETIMLNKSSILFQYLNGKTSIEELEKISEYLNFPLYFKNYSVCSIVIIDNEINNIAYDLNRIIDDVFKSGYEVLHRYDGQIIIINSWDNSLDYSKVKIFYNKLKDNIIDQLKLEVFIAIGDLISDIQNLEFSYMVSNSLKKYILTEGTNICLDRHSINNTNRNNLTFSKEIDTINKFIIERDMDSFEKYIEDIFKDNNFHPNDIYDLSVKILFLIDKTLEEFKLNRIDNKYGNDSLSNIIIKLCNENTRENIKSFIISELKELINLMNNSEIKYSPVVQQVVNIVNQSYQDELSLKTLAQKYNINSSYLGQIFTKEVGISFSEYLNKIKNTKAKELILTTNMKINDIAKSVGYIDTSYFYRKFKKYFGVCPSTLRSMKKY